jgi:hypothetical protein
VDRTGFDLGGGGRAVADFTRTIMNLRFSQDAGNHVTCWPTAGY